MTRAEQLRAIAKAALAYAKAQESSDKAAAIRAALGTDCTRARMTTANARWMTAAEERDRCWITFANALDALAGSR